MEKKEVEISHEKLLERAQRTITTLSEKGELLDLTAHELLKWNAAMKIIDEEYEQRQKDNKINPEHYQDASNDNQQEK